jgi:hypothetical protein
MWRHTQPSLVITQRVSAITSGFRDHGSRGQELSRGDTRSLVWRGDIVKPLNARWTLEAGGRAEFERTSQGFHAYAPAGGIRVVVVEEQSFLSSNTVLSGWGQLARRTASGGLVAGLRLSNASAGSWTTASPWLMGERTIGGVTLRASASAASQFPDLVFLKMSPAATIAPERARSVDLGVERRGRTLRWGITGFVRDESSVLRRTAEERVVDGVHVLPSTFPRFSASLSGAARGVDMILERRATAGPSGWLGYTWAHTRYHDVRTGEVFDGDCDQRHTLNAFVRQRLSYRFTVSAKMRAGSNFPIVGYFAGTPRELTLSDTRNQVRLPLYFRLDLQANRTFTFKSRRLTLFVEIMNVTNRRNLAQADGTVSANLVASRFADQVIPRLPSLGMLIEF